MNKEKIFWALIYAMEYILLFVSVLAIAFGGSLGKVLGVIGIVVASITFEWIRRKAPTYITYR